MAYIEKFKNDYDTYEDLRSLFHTGSLAIHTDFIYLSRKKSYFYSPWSELIPLLGLIVLSIAAMFFWHLLIGVTLLVINVFIFLLIIRPLIADHLHQQIVDLLLQDYDSFLYLWRNGGIIITHNEKPWIKCHSPYDDWREFINTYFAKSYKTPPYDTHTK